MSSLSDKIIFCALCGQADCSGSKVKTIFVKASIKQLKELGDNINSYYCMIDKKHHIDITIEDIDEIMGPKLT